MDPPQYTDWSTPPPSYSEAEFPQYGGGQQSVNDAAWPKQGPTAGMSEVIIDGRKTFIPTSAVSQIARTARPVDLSAMPDPKWPEPPGPRRGTGTWARMRVNDNVAYAPSNYMCHSGLCLGIFVMVLNPLCGVVGMVLGIMAMSATVFDSNPEKARKLARYSKIASLLTLTITIVAVVLIVLVATDTI